MVKETSAGLVIFRKNNETKYLLLYALNYWNFPKGLVEKDESPEQTAIKAVKEETGIKDIKLIPNFKEKITYFYKREGKIIYKEAIFYLAKTNTKEVKLSSEHDNYNWFTYEDTLKHLKFKNQKNILEKANKFIKNEK